MESRSLALRISVGATIDMTHLVLVVREGAGPGRAVQKIDRDLLRMNKHPHMLVWDMLRLAFQRSGFGEPDPSWQDFATSVSTVARLTDLCEAKLMHQKENT